MIIEMRKPEPVWQDLPSTFKINVIKRLDYSSRCQLRLCSHSDKQTVDKCVLGLDRVTMTTHPNFSVNTLIEILKPKETFRFTCDFFRAPGILGKIFSKPLVSARVLNVDCLLLPEILLSFKRHNVSKFKVESVKIDRLGRGTEQFHIRDSCLEFLEYLDVKSMKIEGKCQGEYFNRLIRMDQWKKTTSIHFPTRNEFLIDHFFHFNTIQLSLKTLSTDEARSLIKNFMEKKTVELGTTFFKISTEQPMIPEDILQTTNDFDLRRKLTRSSEENYDRILVRKLKMTHSPLIFVVKAELKMISGSVCRTEHTEMDFIKTIGPLRGY